MKNYYQYKAVVPKLCYTLESRGKLFRKIVIHKSHIIPSKSECLQVEGRIQYRFQKFRL